MADVPEGQKPPEPPPTLFPRCPKCGTDPIELKRFRYDFDDGVIVETIFCANPACRSIISGQIIAVERRR